MFSCGIAGGLPWKSKLKIYLYCTGSLVTITTCNEYPKEDSAINFFKFSVSYVFISVKMML